MKIFYMGIDVSKGYADFMIIAPNKLPVINSFQLDDTFEGHQALYGILRGFLAVHSGSKILTGLESTGGYENNWYKSLADFQGSLNIQTARLNPLGVMHNSKADLKKNTTDKISARNIAEYLISHPDKVVYQQSDPLFSLRKQWGFVNMLSKQCTQLLNQLNNLIYTANPEILKYCSNKVSDWVLKLLIKYPSADKLKTARFRTVSKIPYLTENKARKLIRDAKRSVASATDSTTNRLIAATARQILHLKGNIAKQTKLMINECTAPEIDLLKSFPGISDSSAIGLFIEIQTVERFHSAKKLASFFGIHPVYKTSGDGASGFKMSKMGRKQPRRTLYMVALASIQCNPLIKELYEYHQEQGKHKMAAIGICMHKILRIIYGMLKHNKPFDPQIDRANRCRNTESINKKPVENPRRRFQDYDSMAPVTRRQRKKRLERGKSHGADYAKSGINDLVPVGNIITKIIEQV